MVKSSLPSGEEEIDESRSDLEEHKRVGMSRGIG